VACGAARLYPVSRPGRSPTGSFPPIADKSSPGKTAGGGGSNEAEAVDGSDLGDYSRRARWGRSLGRGPELRSAEDWCAALAPQRSQIRSHPFTIFRMQAGEVASAIDPSPRLATQAVPVSIVDLVDRYGEQPNAEHQGDD